MSADNWGTCPRCLIKQKAKHEAKQQAVILGYGKVTPEIYEDLKAQAAVEIEEEYTLREDYEIGIMDDGEFFVIYKGMCQVDGCGFGHIFNHEEKLVVGDFNE